MSTRTAKRPFLPAAIWTPAPVIRSGKSRALLIGSVTLSYLLQFGLGIVVAVVVFFIRQERELKTVTESSLAYIADVLLFGGITFVLSITVVLVYRARAHWTWADLGVTPLPRTPAARRMWWRASMVFLAALLLGFAVLAALGFLRGSGGYPQPDVPTSAQLAMILPSSLMAGIGEELVVVAFLVVAMERLGAKAPLIYTVAVVARLAYHVYYGPPVIGLAIWAVAAVWVFRRTRLIVPSVIVHTLWDVNAMLASVSWIGSLIASLGFLILLGCLIVTGIVHLVTRGRPEVPEPWQPALPPPGWFADPSGSGGLRYWDGQGWTSYTAPLRR